MSTESPRCYFFGTFNPIHNGHLVMAQTALTQLGYQQVVFIPAHLPPHRQDDPQMIAFAHRLEMVQRSCRGNPQFSVSDIEAHRPGPSYTVETLRQLIPAFDGMDHPAVPFIIGADALRGLNQWKAAETLAQKVLFVVASREQSPPPQSLHIHHKALPLKTVLLDMPCIGISSSLIRQKCKAEQSVRYLTPPPVADYMAWNALYQE